MQYETKRSTAGLRETLFQELDDLRNGNSTPSRAGAAAKLAVQIINSARIEIDYQKHVRLTDGSTPVASTPDEVVRFDGMAVVCVR